MSAASALLGLKSANFRGECVKIISAFLFLFAQSRLDMALSRNSPCSRSPEINMSKCVQRTSSLLLGGVLLAILAAVEATAMRAPFGSYIYLRRSVVRIGNCATALL
jgi:hypothetical protein